MDAVKFVEERNRMCKSFHDGEGCMSCPVYKEGSRCMAILWKEEIIPVVEKWSKENPCKTRQSEFLKQYPNAKVVDGTNIVCIWPCEIERGMEDVKYCNSLSCDDCRRNFWLQEVE